MLLDQLRRVAREMPSQNLEDATWMLQRRVGLILARLAGFATAILAVTAAGFRVTGLARRPTGFLRRSPL